MLNSEHRWNDIKTIFEDVLPDITKQKVIPQRAATPSKSKKKTAASKKKAQKIA